MTLVLVHGASETEAVWDSLVDELASRGTARVQEQFHHRKQRPNEGNK